MKVPTRSERDRLIAFLTANAEFSLQAEPDDQPIRGNALCSGDPAVDREYEDSLIERVNSGDVWAWCVVRVDARYGGYEGTDTLGGCSYSSEAEFCRPGDYYDDMRAEAVRALADSILEAAYPVPLPTPEPEAEALEILEALPEA